MPLGLPNWSGMQCWLNSFWVVVHYLPPLKKLLSKLVLCLPLIELYKGEAAKKGRWFVCSPNFRIRLKSF